MTLSANGKKIESHSPATSITTAHAPSPPAFTDEALALSLAEDHADDLRYVAAWSRWMIWDGQRWRSDDTLRAFDLVREACRRSAFGCNQPKIATALASANTVAAVERLSKSDRRLAATVGQWDADPWQINTPAGIVDLRDGTLSPHDPNAYLTNITSAVPGNACPMWEDFLDRVTGGNVDLQKFLQRMAGYLLTGSTSAHSIFFIYGLGANGKSVFMNTLASVLGDYHRVAPIETFTASSNDRHPTDLAGLRGARLVTAVETEEGRRWAESRIKALTGGDKIAARFMRQDFFEFVPQFKLLIAGNHKPGLRSVDEAIRRRFNLIPFAVTIPPKERDGGLADALCDEWPGILGWMIAGCIEWQRDGLAPPAIVTAATDAYLEGEDGIAAWIDECCKRDADAWTSSSELFLSWKVWAERSGEYSGSLKRLSQNLESRGFLPVRRRDGRGFAGLCIDNATTENG